MIELPNDMAAQVASSSSSLIGELSPVLVLIVGVLLAGVVVQLIIHAIKR